MSVHLYVPGCQTRLTLCRSIVTFVRHIMRSGFLFIHTEQMPSYSLLSLGVFRYSIKSLGSLIDTLTRVIMCYATTVVYVRILFLPHKATSSDHQSGESGVPSSSVAGSCSGLKEKRLLENPLYWLSASNETLVILLTICFAMICL